MYNLKASTFSVCFELIVSVVLEPIFIFSDFATLDAMSPLLSKTLSGLACIESFQTTDRSLAFMKSKLIEIFSAFTVIEPSIMYCTSRLDLILEMSLLTPRKVLTERPAITAVSYTHLTLPTILLV